MSNPFYYLFGLLLATAYPLGNEPLFFVRHFITPWVVVGALVVYALVCWAVLSRDLNRPQLARFMLRVLALLLYAVLLFVYHVPLWVAERLRVEDAMASTLLTLAPLLGFYGILAVIHARVEPNSGGLRFAFRGFVGLSFLPILLMLLLDEVFERVVFFRRLAFVYPAVGWLLALGGLTLLMVFLPFFLRGILGARSMETGPLRDRLERMCATAGFRASDLLVVPTGTSRMANAFVVGLGSGWRYVFFTEAILQGMTPEELECVLVHEVTHSKKRHILFYLFAALSFSMLSGLAHEAFEAAGLPAPLPLLLILAWAGLFWGVAFGYVSRRFETEADLVAARVAPPAENGLAPYAAARRMAAALDRVAWLNHVPIATPTWRHFTIEKRIDILVRSEIDPTLGLAFERVCDRLRTGAVVLLLGGLLCGGVLFGLQIARAPSTRALLQAHESVDRGRRELDEKHYEKALNDLRGGIDGGSDSGVVWIWVADCERALGREEEARKAEATARKRGVSDPRLRLRLDP